MGRIEEKSIVADVICQHKSDGSIIPIKIRVEDEDGEYHIYQIRAYKDISMHNTCNMPSGARASSHIWVFDCKIMVFNMEKRIQLFYNAYDNVWRVTYMSI